MVLKSNKVVSKTYQGMSALVVLSPPVIVDFIVVYDSYGQFHPEAPIGKNEKFQENRYSLFASIMHLTFGTQCKIGSSHQTQALNAPQ